MYSTMTEVFCVQQYHINKYQCNYRLTLSIDLYNSLCLRLRPLSIAEITSLIPLTILIFLRSLRSLEAISK